MKPMPTASRGAVTMEWNNRPIPAVASANLTGTHTGMCFILLGGFCAEIQYKEYCQSFEARLPFPSKQGSPGRTIAECLQAGNQRCDVTILEGTQKKPLQKQFRFCAYSSPFVPLLTTANTTIGSIDVLVPMKVIASSTNVPTLRFDTCLCSFLIYLASRLSSDIAKRQRKRVVYLGSVVQEVDDVSPVLVLLSSDLANLDEAVYS
ncbi:hypothetical protein HBH53_231160 [Parastagonospora nodorum]|nr:hypothetical protein HBH53_231160 [Parastagonospora nodorum]KAH3956665.1 hypothetical protein HBH51_237550 [Parastagonospora nodorum]KAH4215676.1 hypothetical protein HBI06_244320 [Parastagonospora nodorum]KAH4224464.1 hypothetical protein HBI05_236580 [Parastagonospora nodorum]KAH4355640.1 hypothetical protein HBH97_236690 [Parastagonospora nodorum]